MQDSGKSAVAYPAAVQSRRRELTAAATPATCLAAGRGEAREGNGPDSRSYEYVLGQTATDTEGRCRYNRAGIFGHAESVWNECRRMGQGTRMRGSLAPFHDWWTECIPNKRSTCCCCCSLLLLAMTATLLSMTATTIPPTTTHATSTIRNENVQAFTSHLVAPAAAAEGRGTDEEAEALRRKVFADEKGFLESSAFNPARARAEREEQEARALAARWGSTPEKAKEVMKKTAEDKDLSFEVCGVCGRVRVCVVSPRLHSPAALITPIYNTTDAVLPSGKVTRDAFILWRIPRRDLRKGDLSVYVVWGCVWVCVCSFYWRLPR